MRKSFFVWAVRSAVVAAVTAGAAGAVIKGSPGDAIAQTAPGYEYRVLATAKTSTMEEELNDGAEAGFRFQAVMGGETAGEVVVVMVRSAAATRGLRLAVR